MELVVGWLVFAVLVGWYASSKGRSGFGFFLISIVLSPLIGLVIAAIAGDKREKVAKEFAMAETPSVDSHVRCPECRELIRKDARKCKHCGTALVPQ